MKYFPKYYTIPSCSEVEKQGMIRQFKPQDASSCCTLLLRCLERDFSYPPSLKQKILSTETSQSMVERAKTYYIAVYEEKDQILGLAGLDLNEIRLLYVSPEHQRQGIGRSLLAHLQAMVPQTLFSEVFVYSTKQAASFYKTCGFTDRGPHTFNLEGESLPTVFMTSALLPDPLL
jgi:GNAT superfamily N-acetyltransferase